MYILRNMWKMFFFALDWDYFFFGCSTSSGHLEILSSSRITSLVSSSHETSMECSPGWSDRRSSTVEMFFIGSLPEGQMKTNPTCSGNHSSRFWIHISKLHFEGGTIAFLIAHPCKLINKKVRSHSVTTITIIKIIWVDYRCLPQWNSALHQCCLGVRGARPLVLSKMTRAI